METLNVKQEISEAEVPSAVSEDFGKDVKNYESQRLSDSVEVPLYSELRSEISNHPVVKELTVDTFEKKLIIESKKEIIEPEPVNPIDVESLSGVVKQKRLVSLDQQKLKRRRVDDFRQSLLAKCERIGLRGKTWESYQSEKPSQSEPIPRFRKERRGWLTEYWCDGCSDLIQRDDHHRCGKCRDYDLCKRCTDTISHEHFMWKVPSSSHLCNKDENLQLICPLCSTTQRKDGIEFKRFRSLCSHMNICLANKVSQFTSY